jgi:hypothetical protein
MNQCNVHALKGLACRVRVTPLTRQPRTALASSAQRSRRLRCTRAAAPGLLAQAEVTKRIIFFNGSKTSAPHGIIVCVMACMHSKAHESLHRYRRSWQARALHITTAQPAVTLHTRCNKIMMSNTINMHADV